MGDNALLAVGVSADDERVYRDLLRRPRATLPELAAHTGRTVVTLRRTFARLEELGLVSRLAGRPVRFLATRPDVAVAALISRREEALAQARLGVTLFEVLWRSALPLPLFDDAPASPPDPELFTLLAAGLKDEAAARQLGVSLRTVHRRVSDLMDRLGARTRFQAGLLAARRGWGSEGA